RRFSWSRSSEAFTTKTVLLSRRLWKLAWLPSGQVRYGPPHDRIAGQPRTLFWRVRRALCWLHCLRQRTVPIAFHVPQCRSDTQGRPSIFAGSPQTFPGAPLISCAEKRLQKNPQHIEVSYLEYATDAVAGHQARPGACPAFEAFSTCVAVLSLLRLRLIALESCRLKYPDC